MTEQLPKTITEREALAVTIELFQEMRIELDAQLERRARYERLLNDVLDLTMIADDHPRGIKALIREALK